MGSATRKGAASVRRTVSASPTVVYTSIGGACPTQAFGTVDGLPCYFRYRYGGWQFSVAEDASADPVDVRCGRVLGWTWAGETGDGYGGFMERAEVEAIVLRCVSTDRATWPRVEVP